MGKFKASGKISRLSDVYSQLDDNFKDRLVNIINENGSGSSLLRLLLLTKHGIHTPGGLLEALVDRYDLDRHYFNINGHALNITLDDVLYITGLPIDGRAVIAPKTRDDGAFTRVFTNLDTDTMTTAYLEGIAKNTTKLDRERLTALILLVIVCFVTPVCEDNVVHNHLVQFVENIHEVNSYSWGAAFLASLYVGIEKFKSTKSLKKRVDGNCWPLLVFFCLRIPKLCTNLGFNIPLENQRAPLLDYCMGPMKQMANNKILNAESIVKDTFEGLNDEDITWHPYNETMLDDDMSLNHLSSVYSNAPMINMHLVAHHRPICHLRQFRGLENYVDLAKSVKAVPWARRRINLKGNRGNNNQDLPKHYKNWISLWNNREPISEYIRKALHLENEENDEENAEGIGNQFIEHGEENDEENDEEHDDQVIQNDEEHGDQVIETCNNLHTSPLPDSEGSPNFRHPPVTTPCRPQFCSPRVRSMPSPMISSMNALLVVFLLRKMQKE